MTRGNRPNQAGACLVLGLFVVSLMIFLSLSFSADNVITASFRLDDVQICEELDDDLNPINPGTALSGGAKQVCLWFKYSRAREGDVIEIVWELDGRMIQKDSYRLQESEGTRAFYLLKEDGGVLPGGVYSARVACNGRERRMERFSIEVISGDGESDMYEVLD